MSSLSIDKLLQTLHAPKERVRECRGDESAGNFTELIRFDDPEWGMVVQKKYAGNLEDLINGEVQTLQYINSRFKNNEEARRYLCYCVGTETRQVAGGGHQETLILMKWHGFDIQDLIYLLPPEFNTHWGNPVFVAQLLYHALKSLRVLHSMGIVHGDIKWDNIVLGIDANQITITSFNREIILEPAKLRLIDFGISSGRLTSYEHLFGINFNNLITFKSPSLKAAHAQLKDDQKDDLMKQIGFSVDLYALGAIFGDHVAKHCPTNVLTEQRGLLLKVCRDLSQLDVDGYIEAAAGQRISNTKDDREALYSYLLGLLEPLLENAPEQWDFRLPADNFLLRLGKRDVEQFFTERQSIAGERTQPTLMIKPPDANPATSENAQADASSEASRMTPAPAPTSDSQPRPDNNLQPTLIIRPGAALPPGALSPKASVNPVPESATNPPALPDNRLSAAPVSHPPTPGTASARPRTVLPPHASSPVPPEVAGSPASLALKFITVAAFIAALAFGSVWVIKRYGTGTSGNTVSYQGIEFLRVPPEGEPTGFTMGCVKGDNDCGPWEKPHKETINQVFFLGKYEITQGQWKAIMGGGNPSKFAKGDNYPVERITRKDASEFAARLSAKAKEEGGPCCYRLPTEAEWEYAARAGTTARYYFGNDVTELIEHAWYKANANGTTRPVGQKAANPWGFHDLYGNVGEWTLGAKSVSSLVARGGDWDTTGDDLRTSNSRTATDLNTRIGFRLVLEPVDANLPKD